MGLMVIMAPLVVVMVAVQMIHMVQVEKALYPLPDQRYWQDRLDRHFQPNQSRV